MARKLDVLFPGRPVDYPYIIPASQLFENLLQGVVVKAEFPVFPGGVLPDIHLTESDFPAMMVASGQLIPTHPPLSGTPLSGNTDFSLHQYRFRCPEAMGIHIKSSAIHPGCSPRPFPHKTDAPHLLPLQTRPRLSDALSFPPPQKPPVTKFRPGIQMHGGTVGKQQTVFPAIGYG